MMCIGYVLYLFKEEQAITNQRHNVISGILLNKAAVFVLNQNTIAIGVGALSPRRRTLLIVSRRVLPSPPMLAQDTNTALAGKICYTAQRGVRLNKVQYA